jgi:hypothetical protein
MPVSKAYERERRGVEVAARRRAGEDDRRFGRLPELAPPPAQQLDDIWCEVHVPPLMALRLVHMAVGARATDPQDSLGQVDVAPSRGD